MASTAHLDSQGHHPKVRPYNRRNKIWGFIKVAARLSPKSVHLSASDNELQETMIVETGCADSGMWYVDTAGCGMLQANDAEPPPKRGWLYKAVQCVAVFLLGLMLLAGPASCKKDPQPTPTPNTPTDTITPINNDTVPGIPNDTVVPNDTIQGDTIIPTPGDTIVPGGDTVVIPGKVVNFYYRGGEEFPSPDSIRYYAYNPEYDTVYIKWMVPNSDRWTPVGFYGVWKDGLQPLFDISPKVYGGGLMRVYQILPDCDSTAINKKGISDGVARWYGDHGYNVYPVVTGGKSQKVIKANNRIVGQPPRYNNAYQPRGRSH